MTDEVELDPYCTTDELLDYFATDPIGPEPAEEVRTRYRKLESVVRKWIAMAKPLGLDETNLVQDSQEALKPPQRPEDT